MGFQDALNTTLGFEGGYSNDPSDNGGETINGISSNYWPQDYALQKNLIDTGKTDLAVQHLQKFYKNNFWDQIGADNLPEKIQSVAFDTAVNNGVPVAKRLLEASKGDPNTFLSLRQGYDTAIAEKNPSQAGHEEGWKNRIDALRVKVAQNTQQKTASDASIPLVAGTAPIDDHLDNIISSNQQAQPAEPIPSHLDDILGGGAQSPAAPAVENPTAPQTTPTAAGARDAMYRFAHGMQDPLAGIAQGAAHAIDFAEPGYAQNIDKEINQREEDYKKNHPVDGVDWSRLAGNVVSPANALLPLKAIAGIKDGGSALLRMAKGAMAGGAMAAAQPTQTSPDGSYSGEKIFQTGAGAAIGGVLPLAGSAVAGVIKPSVSADAQKLIDEGVPTSMGQTSGGGWIKALEDKASSILVIGGMIKDAQANGIDGMNRAAVNRGLNHIGQELPPNISTGHEAIEYAQQKFNDAYDSVLPQISGDLKNPTTNYFGQNLIGNAPQDFTSKVGDMLKQDYYDMHPDMQEKLKLILKKEVVDRVNADGTFDGEQAKTVESRLTQFANKYSGTQDTDATQLSHAINDIKGLFRDQMAGNNPAAADQLQNINRGYANFKIVQKAASSPAAENGVFTPSQLTQSVRSSDRSVSKGNFAKGQALMQDLANASKNVLPNKIPNSGTVDRGLVAAAAGALAGGGAGAVMAHPIAGTALGALAGIYSKPGQAAARYLMTARPKGAGALSELVRRATDTSSLSPYAH